VAVYQNKIKNTQLINFAFKTHKPIFHKENPLPLKPFFSFVCLSPMNLELTILKPSFLSLLFTLTHKPIKTLKSRSFPWIEPGFVENQIKFRARRIPNPNSDSYTNHNPDLHHTTKGKSCKVCLYYSSILKIKSKKTNMLWSI
jgi:hypothetical protein